MIEGNREPYKDFRVIKEDQVDWINDSASVLDRIPPEDIAKEIRRLGLDVETEESIYKFSLTSGSVQIRVEQGAKKTALYFLPKEDLKIDLETFRKLFFVQIPEAMYANLGTAAPPETEVENATVVRYKKKEAKNEEGDDKFYPEIPPKLSLVHSGSREHFEDLLTIDEKKKKLLSVTMEIESDEMVPYSLTLPNVENGFGEVVFSFSSENELTEETMELLFSLHKMGPKQEDRQNYYAEKFAWSINLIREQLRTP